MKAPVHQMAIWAKPCFIDQKQAPGSIRAAWRWRWRWEVGGGEGEKKGSVLAKYLLLFDPIWFSVFWCLHFNDPRSVSERWHVCP